MRRRRRVPHLWRAVGACNTELLIGVIFCQTCMHFENVQDDRLVVLIYLPCYSSLTVLCTAMLIPALPRPPLSLTLQRFHIPARPAPSTPWQDEEPHPDVKACLEFLCMGAATSYLRGAQKQERSQQKRDQKRRDAEQRVRQREQAKGGKSGGGKSGGGKSGGGKSKEKSAEGKKKSSVKGAMSAFMYYSKEARTAVKEVNPDMTFGDIAKKLGADWKVLGAEEKQPFENLAAVDKIRWVKEKAAEKAAEPDAAGAGGGGYGG